MWLTKLIVRISRHLRTKIHPRINLGHILVLSEVMETILSWEAS